MIDTICMITKCFIMRSIGTSSGLATVTSKVPVSRHHTHTTPCMALLAGVPWFIMYYASRRHLLP